MTGLSAASQESRVWLVLIDMNEINDNDPGFRAEIHKLSENRPALSEMRLDEIKRQVIGRRRRTGSSLSLFLRTRAAIITAIAAGAI